MSSTMLLGTLLKVQQFIHDNEVTVKKTSECNHILVNIKKLLISKRRIGILKKLPKQGEDSESL